jgi:hypothetical protein
MMSLSFSRRPHARRSILFGAALLGFLTSACAISACAQSRGRAPAARDTVIIGVADTAAHLYRSPEGNGPDTSTRRVMRDQRNLEELWKTIDSLLPLPRVDFARSDVLVAAFGAWGRLEPAINIDTVLTRGAERIVIVRVTSVAEDCLMPSEMTYPIDIVVVPRDSTRTTRFIERKTRLRGCLPSPPAIIRWNTPRVKRRDGPVDGSVEAFP